MTTHGREDATSRHYFPPVNSQGIHIVLGGHSTVAVSSHSNRYWEALLASDLSVRQFELTDWWSVPWIWLSLQSRAKVKSDEQAPCSVRIGTTTQLGDGVSIEARFYWRNDLHSLQSSSSTYLHDHLLLRELFPSHQPTPSLLPRLCPAKIGIIVPITDNGMPISTSDIR